MYCSAPAMDSMRSLALIVVVMMRGKWAHVTIIGAPKKRHGHKAKGHLAVPFQPPMQVRLKSCGGAP